MTEDEFRILFNALDNDHSGRIDYKEFARKMERYGVTNLGREQYILYYLAKNIPKFGLNLAEFFDLVD